MLNWTRQTGLSKVNLTVIISDSNTMYYTPPLPKKPEVLLHFFWKMFVICRQYIDCYEKEPKICWYALDSIIAIMTIIIITIIIKRAFVIMIIFGGNFVSSFFLLFFLSFVCVLPRQTLLTHPASTLFLIKSVERKKVAFLWLLLLFICKQFE